MIKDFLCGLYKKNSPDKAHEQGKQLVTKL